MKKKICVIGAGRWGKNHIGTLYNLGCLSGIVEINKKLRKELINDYPSITIYTDYKDTIKEDFDGFVVATPAETHYAIADYLIRHNKPVLVEKPVALTVKEAEALHLIAEKKNINFMVGHVLLFHPAIRKIKELINQGKIGKLEYIYSNRLNLGTVRTEENILWSFAPHDISIFQYLIETSPSEIVSRGGAFLQPTIHDSTLTILKYPDNIIGHIFVSWLHPFKEHRLVVIGSKGMISFEDSSKEKEILFYEKGIDWVRGEPIKRDGPTETIPYEQVMPLTEELKYFIEHINGDPIEIANSRSAVEVLDILEKASNSLLRGKESIININIKNSGNNSNQDYFVHSTSLIDHDVKIGAGTKIWHFSHIQSGSIIGHNCSIGQNVNVGNNVKISNNVKIQNNVSVYEGVELEDYVFCGPSMVFTNVKQPRSEFPQKGSKYYKKTLVKKSASLGANCTIVCGTTIGQYAFVGAGAVITRDVPDFALVVGNPARFIGWICKCGQKLLESKSITKECKKCKRKYILIDNILSCEE
jgi:UDP-2-acetamido-3-amino-2,3-dideoxy-glucuronate N-acetyltransferase